MASTCTHSRPAVTRSKLARAQEERAWGIAIQTDILETEGGGEGRSVRRRKAQPQLEYSVWERVDKGEGKEKGGHGRSGNEIEE